MAHKNVTQYILKSKRITFLIADEIGLLPRQSSFDEAIKKLTVLWQKINNAWIMFSLNTTDNKGNLEKWCDF